MNKKIMGWIAVALGIILFIVAIVYLMTPAGSLPTYMPGFEVGSATIHIKHSIAAFILGLALFAYAWFTTEKKEHK